MSTLDTLFAGLSLSPPPLAHALAAALRPEGDTAFATPGWPGQASLQQAITTWLADPAPDRAWAGLTGHGLRSTAVRLCLCTPEAGFFLQRQWTAAFGEEAQCRDRIEGAFALLARIQAAMATAQASGRWPAGQRLVLVDDDFDRLHWGWVPHGATALPPLAMDPLAYLNLLLTVEALGAAQPAVPA